MNAILDSFSDVASISDDTMQNMSIHRVIREGRKRLQMTEQQFADAVGVTRTAVNQWEKEGGTAPTRKNQPAVAKLLGITVAELTGGNPYLQEPASQHSVQEPQAIYLTGNPEYPAIRRVSIKAQAGVTGYAVEYMNEDGPPIVFRRDWYTMHGYRPEKMLALRIAGESMVPSLYPGDLVVVNTAQPEPKDGIAFVVAYEGEVLVKRLIRDAGQWWLNSDNQDQRRYPRKVCNGDTEIIGEVVYRQTERI